MFTYDLNPPDFNEYYNITPYISDIGLYLIHKLVYFPDLLQEYLPLHPDEINFQTHNKLTPLHIACINGINESVKILLKSAKPTPLSLAWVPDKVGGETVSRFLKYPQINVNVRDKDGWTPLLLACVNNKIDIVKELLNHSQLDINIQDNGGYTALMWSIDPAVDIDITNILISHPNLDINLQNKIGFTALLCACQYNSIIEKVNILLQHPKIDINLKTIDNYTALSLSSVLKKVDIVKLLLQKNAIPTDKDDLPTINEAKASLYDDIIHEYKELKRLRELDLGSLVYQSSKKYI